MPVIFVLFSFPFFSQGTFNFSYNQITLLHAITSQQVEFFGKVKTKIGIFARKFFLYNDIWKEEETKGYLCKKFY